MTNRLEINLRNHFTETADGSKEGFWDSVLKEAIEKAKAKQWPVSLHPQPFLKQIVPYVEANAVYSELRDKNNKDVVLVIEEIPKFGLSRTQHESGKRTIKPSWNWYIEIIPKEYAPVERESFLSTFRKVYNWEPMNFPPFSGTRIMMMPVRLGWLDGIPEQYWRFMERLYGMIEERHHGEIGYLTIDERELQPGETLRRGGLHVDGYYHGNAGAWGGGNGPGGGWGSVGNGMLTVSSTAHCRGYLGMVYGKPGDEGEADHLVLPNEGTLFEANEVYWVDGACIHESLPVEQATKRQFVRLSLPNNGPWFEGYTTNPDAEIKPTGPILPRRDKFMKEQSMDKQLFDRMSDMAPRPIDMDAIPLTSSKLFVFQKEDGSDELWIEFFRNNGVNTVEPVHIPARGMSIYG